MPQKQFQHFLALMDAYSNLKRNNRERWYEELRELWVMDIEAEML